MRKNGREREKRRERERVGGNDELPGVLITNGSKTTHQQSTYEL